MKLKDLAEVSSPRCSPNWMEASDDERLSRIIGAIASRSQWSGLVEVVESRADGQVILRFLSPVGAHQRGGLLLDIEEHLKSCFDPGLTVWLEPLGDRSSLRRLRGIEVKS